MKRSGRLVAITQQFIANPHHLLSLTDFSKQLDVAKSSISEDLDIINDIFKMLDIGWIETVSGATGGAAFIPYYTSEKAKQLMEQLGSEIASVERILPGHYIYLSDILGNNDMLDQLGYVVASRFFDIAIDVVMTTATKGVPFAQSVSRYLNVPFVIVRRDSKITEGSTVSINYLAKSANRIEKMELSRRSLNSDSRVLIVDDFMNGGGTFRGMADLVREFNCTLVNGVALCENISEEDKQFFDYLSIFKVNPLDITDSNLSVSLGSIFDDYPKRKDRN